MKFLFDHDVAANVALVLRARGHDVVELRTVLPTNAPDTVAWKTAIAEGRIMVTCNRNHFQALAVATETYPGLILLFRRRTHQAEAGRLLNLLKSAGEHGLANNINFA